MTVNEDVRKITDEEYQALIDRLDVVGEGKVEPLGLFYCTDRGKDGNTVYIGVDNSSGDLWVEEFKSLGACKRWLLKG